MSLSGATSIKTRVSVLNDACLVLFKRCAVT